MAVRTRLIAPVAAMTVLAGCGGGAGTEAATVVAAAVVELGSGGGGRLQLSLSPSGEHVLVGDGNRLCFHEVTAAPEPDGDGSADLDAGACVGWEGLVDGVAWSPQSDAVALTDGLRGDLDAIATGGRVDSDIWVLARDGSLADLTDDGLSGAVVALRDAGKVVAQDFHPAWSRDGSELAFWRVTGAQDLVAYRIPAVGGEPSPVVTATGVLPGPLALHDGVVYFTDHGGASRAGIYRVGDGGGLGTVLAFATTAGGALEDWEIVEIGPDGRRALVWSRLRLNQGGGEAVALLDLTSAELRPLPLPPAEDEGGGRRVVPAAGLSPDGDAVAYVIDDITTAGAELALVDADLASPARVVWAGPAPGFGHVEWGDNDLLLLPPASDTPGRLLRLDR